jgi:hypothetical protein
VGTSLGELIVVKSNCLAGADVLGLEKDGMCLGKSYPAHVSVVDRLGVDNLKKWLFTAGSD